MYEAPIQVNMLNSYEKFKSEIDEMIGDNVYQRVLEMSIQVDRDELEKAMLYDRHQYLKGYRDGLAEAEKRIEKAREALEGI